MKMADIDLHECIRATQRSLGRIVEHPRLSDALLARPPFRFLHDIVMQVIEITGFGKDIFTALECDSARVTERDSKIAFLEKLISAVSIKCPDMRVTATPPMIVAGMEPEKTNLLLQQLYAAATGSMVLSAPELPKLLILSKLKSIEFLTPKTFEALDSDCRSLEVEAERLRQESMVIMSELSGTLG